MELVSVKVTENYQSEDELERELVHDLENQGYEYVPGLNIPEKMLVWCNQP
jgi:type I restriction enzyme R subunit